MCEFSAYVAFDKATNGQTEDIKHEMGKHFVNKRQSLSMSFTGQVIASFIALSNCSCNPASDLNIARRNHFNTTVFLARNASKQNTTTLEDGMRLFERQKFL